MHTLRFKKIDAFASQYSTGNQTAVAYLDSAEKLSSVEMLQLAKELKGFVSEVGLSVQGQSQIYKADNIPSSYYLQTW
ncbi:hypothetical protein OA79_03445 [Marinomonas sp. TW1]|nr:hypothetical protein OA79_03445 [Marinomonas sp. TW1]